MHYNRREWLAMAAASQVTTPPGGRPLVCIFSKHLAKLPYTELGAVAKDLGFDGVDLAVRPGGHVEPQKVQVDLLRALESIRGEGIEVPMITTGLLSPGDPAAMATLYIAGRAKVPFFKPGYYRYAPADRIDDRIAHVRRDFSGLAAMGRQFGITAGFHNHSGDYVGAAVWDIRAILADLDPQWAGYYFDPAHATIEGGLGGWLISLRMALSRVKMIALKDFYWEKRGGKWEVQWCPMGEGMVQWAEVFRLIAESGFTGPVSLHVEYEPANEAQAISKDLAFIKKQIQAAYRVNLAPTRETN